MDWLERSLVIPQSRIAVEDARLSIEGCDHGTSGAALLRFAGTISDQEAEEIERAVTEGCEQIDQGW